MSSDNNDHYGDQLDVDAGMDRVEKRINEAIEEVEKINDKLVYYRQVEATLKSVLKEVRNYSAPNRAFGTIQQKEAFLVRKHLRDKIERILIDKEIPL